MNVLIVDQFGEIAGAQRCLLDLLAGWPVNAGRVVLAAPARGRLLATAASMGIDTFGLSCGEYTSGRKSIWDVLRFCLDQPLQRRILRGIIERNSIDTVYVNGPRVLAAAAAAAKGRCRVVFHAHNFLTRRYELALVRDAVSGSHASVIACCDNVAGPLRRTVRCRVHVIVNGVPEVRWRPRSTVRGSAPWRLGLVGRISPEKGHIELLEAARTLAGSVAIIIAGTSMFGTGGYEREVRRKAGRLDVRFAGWQNDVASVLHALDLLVVPSIAEPGLPRVVLEAFSAGVPVVAFPTGGIAEAVRHGETGFLAAEPTPAALAQTLRAVMSMPAAELQRVTRNARAAWEAQWNVDRWRRDVLAVLRSTNTGPLPSPREPASARGATVAPSEPPVSAAG